MEYIGRAWLNDCILGNSFNLHDESSMKYHILLLFLLSLLTPSLPYRGLHRRFGLFAETSAQPRNANNLSSHPAAGGMHERNTAIAELCGRAAVPRMTSEFHAGGTARGWECKRMTRERESGMGEERKAGLHLIPARVVPGPARPPFLHFLPLIRWNRFVLATRYQSLGDTDSAVRCIPKMRGKDRGRERRDEINTRFMMKGCKLDERDWRLVIARGLADSCETLPIETASISIYLTLQEKEISTSLIIIINRFGSQHLAPRLSCCGHQLPRARLEKRNARRCDWGIGHARGSLSFFVLIGNNRVRRNVWAPPAVTSVPVLWKCAAAARFDHNFINKYVLRIWATLKSIPVQRVDSPSAKPRWDLQFGESLSLSLSPSCTLCRPSHEYTLEDSNREKSLVRARDEIVSSSWELLAKFALGIRSWRISNARNYRGDSRNDFREETSKVHH